MNHCQIWSNSFHYEVNDGNSASFNINIHFLWICKKGGFLKKCWGFFVFSKQLIYGHF